MNARQKEDLRAIDVADAGHDTLIQERVADGSVGSPQPLEKRALAGARRDGIRAQPIQDRAMLLPADELAGWRPDQIPRDLLGCQPQADRRSGGGSRGREAVEVSEHPQVNVHDRTIAPVVKKVLASCFRALEDRAVEAPRLPGKARLGSGGPDAVARKIPVLLSGEAVKDRTFRHVNQPAGRAPRG